MRWGEGGTNGVVDEVEATIGLRLLEAEAGGVEQAEGCYANGVLGDMAVWGVGGIEVPVVKDSFSALFIGVVWRVARQ